MTERIAYSPKEVEAKTGLGRGTIWRAMKAGRLRYSHIGARRVILADDMWAWLRGNGGAYNAGGFEGDARGRPGPRQGADSKVHQ